MLNSKVKKIHILFLLIGCMAFLSCKKTEEVIIPNNTSPTDHTISELTKKNYINKVYISVLGREPSTAELNTDLAVLNSGNFSSNSRAVFLDAVLNKQGYSFRNWIIASNELLNATDTSEIRMYIAIYTSLLSNTSFQNLWPVIEIEIHKLQLMYNVPGALQADSLDIIGMHKRCVFNYFYDQINMGTSNFVTATFQNFLNRYPTDAELENAINMVDGFNASLFLETGNSKSDFITIFFNSDNYFEGQVRALFIRYLFRAPNSAEMTDLSLKYKADKNYKLLQKRILLLDEYVGI
ncbi:MAG TPA: hypothetical protein PLN13_10905 [Bacteroidia bacterium]|nr:hypothetical protein [Bacteroidia bacterium]HRH09080.1 hypothetical protein [Bacteroidia bacterium]